MKYYDITKQDSTLTFVLTCPVRQVPRSITSTCPNSNTTCPKKFYWNLSNCICFFPSSI